MAFYQRQGRWNRYRSSASRACCIGLRGVVRRYQLDKNLDVIGMPNPVALLAMRQISRYIVSDNCVGKGLH